MLSVYTMPLSQVNKPEQRNRILRSHSGLGASGQSSGGSAMLSRTYRDAIADLPRFYRGLTADFTDWVCSFSIFGEIQNAENSLKSSSYHVYYP
jgi:hypothetical protein